MYKAILPLMMLVAATVAPASARPFIPRPPEGVIVTEGATVTIEGTLKVQNLEGKLAFLTNFSTPVFQRNVAYYPAVMPAPGIMPHPRPPFLYTPLQQIALFGADLTQAAKLVGTEAKVTVTGTVTDSPRAMVTGITVAKVELRGHALPTPLPTVQRLIASAKKAVKEHFASMRGMVLVGDLTAKNQGGLLIEVRGHASSGMGGAVGPVVYVYDGVTGELTAPGAHAE